MSSHGVPCPNCGSTQGITSNTRLQGDKVRRARDCLACGSRFVTHEVLREALQLRMDEVEHRLRTVGRAVHGDFDHLEA